MASWPCFARKFVAFGAGKDVVGDGKVVAGKVAFWSVFLRKELTC